MGRGVWISLDSSSLPSSYTARKPGNFTSDRLALNTYPALVTSRFTLS